MTAPVVAASTSGTGATVIYPARSVGDILVVHAAGWVSASAFSSSGVGLTDGNLKAFTTQYQTVVNGGVSGATSLSSTICYRVIDGTESTGGTIGAGVGGGTYAWECFVIYGEDTSSPVNVASSVSTSTTASTFSWATANTTVDDCLVMRFGATGTPTSALDSATVTGHTREKSSRSTTVVGVGAWSKTQATAGAVGTATSSTVASASSKMDTITMAFAPSTGGHARSWGAIIG